MTLKHILPTKLGFGAAPLGNMFRDIPEAEARATVEAAWNDGIRYYDNAPFMEPVSPRFAWARRWLASRALIT